MSRAFLNMSSSSSSMWCSRFSFITVDRAFGGLVELVQHLLDLLVILFQQRKCVHVGVPPRFGCG